MNSIKKETFRDLASLDVFAWVPSLSSAVEPGQCKQPADAAAWHQYVQTLQGRVFQGTSSLVELQLCTNGISLRIIKIT